MSRDLLILWRAGEAQTCFGRVIERSLGSQMEAVERGDRLFISATENDELFLLGIIKVNKTGKTSDKPIITKYGRYYAEGKSLYGKFQMIPLKNIKWRLRFDSKQDRLKHNVSIGYQMQMHRVLTPESAKLLLSILNKSKILFNKKIVEDEKAFKEEGNKMQSSLSKRERDPSIRKYALTKYGYNCMICGINFQDIYGDYKECIEVHHLGPIGLRKKAFRTKIEDVIIVCPNCHRVLHRTDDPSDWKSLKESI